VSRPRASTLAVGLLGVALCAWLGFAWWSLGRVRGPQPSGQLAVAGLVAPLSIARDPFGVPHVEAGSERDAWLGLGFAHAQDRLWQMELLRRAARGQLAELFGASALDADRLARLLGLGRASDAEAQRLSAQTAAVLDAYCRGINAWLSQLAQGSAPRPPELAWLGLEPEPWRPADVLAILRWRAWSSARSLGSALLLDRLVRELGGVPAREFFPVRALDGAHDALAALLELGRAADLLAAAGGLAPRAGSLGFALGPARSISGLPLLASDPHVALDLPPVFYLAHLRAPGLELGGATWPGMPVFWTGTNGSAAWGQVALHASVSDLYEETFLPGHPPRYERSGRWRRAELRVEQIAVRGRAPAKLEIARTRNGPSLAPLLGSGEGGRTLTLRWTGLGAPSGIESLLRLQRARSWDEFRESLRELVVPAASFLYADTSGEIGLQIAGHLPERGVDTGLLPASGALPHYRWRGSLAFDELPSQHGADLPFLVASTHPGELDPRVSWLWSSPGGPERLRARLAAAEPLDLEAVVALQTERISRRGPRSVRRLLAGVSAGSPAARRVLDALRDWDGDTRDASTGAALYHVFRQQLARRILSEQLPAEFARELAELAEPLPGAALARFLDRRDAARSSAQAAAALEDTWSHMRAHVSPNPARWTWGRTRSLRLRHSFERLGGWQLRELGRRFARGPYAAGGDPDSVWSMYHAALPTDEVRVGPGLRYAVDLADPGHAQVGLAGGQSGFPGDPHYADALPDWLAGRARPLWMHRSDVAYHRRGVWELHPRGD
jgi:penicillin amidase